MLTVFEKKVTSHFTFFSVLINNLLCGKEPEERERQNSSVQVLKNCLVCNFILLVIVKKITFKRKK